MRISLGLGRGAAAKIAPWVLIGMALVPMAVLVVLAAFLGSVATDAEDFEPAVVRRVLRLRDHPARAVRRSRRPAPALPGPPRRRALALRRAADHADGLRGRPLGCVLHRLRRRRCLPEAMLFIWNLLDARETGACFGTTGTSCPASCLRGCLRAGAHDAPLLSRRSQRAAPTRRSPRSPCSSSARHRRHRRRTASKAALEDVLRSADLPRP